VAFVYVFAGVRGEQGEHVGGGGREGVAELGV